MEKAEKAEKVEQQTAKYEPIVMKNSDNGRNGRTWWRNERRKSYEGLPFFPFVCAPIPIAFKSSTGSERYSDQPLDGGRGRQLNDGSEHRREQTNKQSWTHRSPSFALCAESAEKKKRLYENKTVEFQSTNCSETSERVLGARVSILLLRVVSMNRLDALVATKKDVSMVDDSFSILIAIVFIQSICRSIQLDVAGQGELLQVVRGKQRPCVQTNADSYHRHPLLFVYLSMKTW